MNQFDNILEALCPSTSPTDGGLNDPCDQTPPTDKNRQVTQLASPTGVGVQEIGFYTPIDNASPQANEPPQSQTTPPSRSMRINETATLVVTMVNLSNGTSQGHQSIRLSASNCNPPSTKLESKEASPTSESRTSEIHNHDQMLYRVFSKDRMKEVAYHVTDFAGLYPVRLIVEFSMAPNRATKDKRMTSFIKCVTALLGEMLYIDDMAMIAPIDITNNNEASFIKSKADLPTNFTKLGKHIMISSGNWVFNKKEKGNNNVYTRFRLKSKIPTEAIINRVSFKFSCVGRKNIFKKQHQAMETETPLMLIFVCNGTDQGSILLDTRQMLDLAYDDIEQNRMMPEEFKNKDIPQFSLRLNVPCLPADTKQNTNKSYDHYKEQGKKAYHFEVAKEEVPYFKCLSGHAHHLRLDNKFFRKFAKFTATLGINAPMSDCVSLRCCIQGYLNFHLSLTYITLHGINMLDASEILRSPADKRTIAKLTLRDLLYRIKLVSKAPLFLQLSQQSTGEVNAVIPNTPEAETMAEQMNVQIAAWCHYYWKEMNPGSEQFYHKLSDRAFSQVLCHEISACTWDPELKAVISPRAQTKIAAIAEFEQQD